MEMRDTTSQMMSFCFQDMLEEETFFTFEEIGNTSLFANDKVIIFFGGLKLFISDSRRHQFQKLVFNI